MLEGQEAYPEGRQPLPDLLFWLPMPPHSLGEGGGVRI